VDRVPNGSSAVKGTSLFCVTAAVSGRYLSRGAQINEEELLKAQKDHGIGVFACDGHLTLRGHRALSDGGWSSYLNNVRAFLGHWEAIRKEGRWKKYEWTVKVDADTVFFPDRLKERLRELRTPKGARVYVRNSDQGRKFSGALEILTAEATSAYLERGGECAKHLDQQGAEDRYMKLCLDAIGVAHQSDYGVLREGTASEDMCMDPRAAAFHPFKTQEKWLECHHAQMAYRTVDILGGPASTSKGQTLLEAGASRKDLLVDPAANAADTTTPPMATTASKPINRTTVTASSTMGAPTAATSGTSTTSVSYTKMTTTSSETVVTSATVITTSSETVTTLVRVTTTLCETVTTTGTVTTTLSETVTITSTLTTTSTSTEISSTFTRVSATSTLTATYSSTTRTDTHTTTGSSITGTDTATTGSTSATSQSAVTSTGTTLTSVSSLSFTLTSTSTVITAPYDCQEDIDVWKEWILAKSVWCCRSQKIGCVGSESAEPYDCHDGLADWKSTWVLQKSLWCCQFKGLGCMADQSPGQISDVMW
jgi:hypothetical protein